MAVIIGQVYYPKFETKTEDGVEKVKFGFSLASRKAFIEDSAKPNLFTPCVTYQAGLAKLLAEHFGKEEHHGKAIVAYGHFNEFEWYPDANNSDHDKYWQPFTITSEYMAQAGIRVVEGSPSEMTIQVPIKQTTRQFVITGFEFADSSNATRTSKPATSAPQIKIGGVSTPVGTGAGAGTGVTLPASDNGTPF